MENKYFIGVDTGVSREDALCVIIAHKSGEIFVIDEEFKTKDSKEFEQKIKEFETKFNVKKFEINTSNKKSKRIDIMNQLLLDNKISLKIN